MSRFLPETNRDRDGFTLIEVLVVVVTMSIIVTSLSLIIVTVLKTAPGAEARDDDSRTLLALTTYMPEDVNSTPPGGFDYGKSVGTGCSGASPGVNLVQMTWHEITNTTQTFMASYRYANSGGGYQIFRYTCRAGQPPAVKEMTSILPSINEAAWTPGAAPVAVTPYKPGGEDRGLTLQVTTIAGDRIDLEMRSNNPEDTLPAVAPGAYPQIPPSNQPPIAGSVNATIQNYLPLNIGLPASDPDGDGVTVQLRNVPANWTTQINALTVTVTTPPLPSILPDGSVHTFVYDVIDPYGQLATGTVTLTVGVIPANGAPTASDVTKTAAAGVPLVINLPVSDPDSDPLQVAQPTGHASLNIQVTGPTQLTVTATAGTTSPGPFNYTVSDGLLTATAKVYLAVTQCNVTSLTPATTSVERMTKGSLKNSVTYTVAYTGPCNNLVLEYKSDGSNAAYLSFGSGNTVTIQGNPGGHSNWTLGAHTMNLRDSQTGPVLRTATLTVTS